MLKREKDPIHPDLCNGYSVLSGFDMFSKMDILQPFSARFPWLGGDLQTIANQIRPTLDKNLANGKRLSLLLNDEGDALSACSTASHLSDNGNPVVIMLHGLGGDENSIYMREATQYFNCQGYDVIRLNLRGAGVSAETSSNIYHAGISQDLRRLLAALPEVISQKGVLLVGFSLGANILLKYLGEDDVPSFVKAGVAVSAPIDLSKSQHRIAEFRNRIYRRYLLKKLKRDFSRIKWREGQAPINSVESLNSIIEFDELVIAPVYGFKNAQDYYAKCSSTNFIDKIKTPTLIVHAKTDPWILADQFESISWKNSDSVCTIMSDDGGHVGFCGKRNKYPWHLHVADVFFDSLMKNTAK